MIPEPKVLNGIVPTVAAAILILSMSFVQGNSAPRIARPISDVSATSASSAPSVCQFHPVNKSWEGSCGPLFGESRTLTITPAKTITTGVWRNGANPTSIWAGDMTASGSPNWPIEVEVYKEGSGVLRTEYGWFPVSGFTLTSKMLAPCAVEGVAGDIQCSRHRVWKNRAAKTGRQIDLNIIVLRAMESPREPDPLFVLAGGPGQAPSTLVKFFATTFSEVRRHRDVVLVDLRGTGKSHPLTCPELATTRPDGTVDDDWLPPDGVRRCRERLERDADLRLYTTEIAMADLDEVRAALGYKQINLYGTSYGTRAAQIYIRDFPQHTRTVTLKGVLPQSVAQPVTHATDGERAWRMLVARCHADAACRSAYPALESDFRSVIGRLERSPAIVQAKSADGRAVKLMLTRGIFGEAFRNVLYSPELAARAPAMVSAFARGDYSPITQMVYQTRMLTSSEISAGFYLSVTCTEDVPFIDVDRAREEAAGTFGGDYRLQQQRRACSLWPRGSLSRVRGQPVTSSVPALLFSGDQDPVAPPERAEEVAKHLANGRHVIVSNNGHAFGSLGECGQRLIAAFIGAKSAAALDVSCASRIPAVPFVIEKRS
jgi:pimeloyl-ACP methyl ester carboxylesterase